MHCMNWDNRTNLIIHEKLNKYPLLGSIINKLSNNITTSVIQTLDELV